MKVVFILVRLTGYLLGSFALLSGLADVLGFIPHSYETPPWPARLVASLPSMLAGAVLLVPIRYCLRGSMLYVLAAGYTLVVLAAVVLSAQALIGYFSGTKDPAIVPAAMIVLYIPVAVRSSRRRFAAKASQALGDVRFRPRLCENPASTGMI